MAVSYKQSERRVIPNWRDYRRTIKLKELASPGSSKIQTDLDQKISDWVEIKNIGTAADLINSAFINDKYDFEEFNNAIEFIGKNSSKASSILLNLAQSINNIPSLNDLEERIDNTLEVDSFDEFQSLLDSKVIHRILHRTKRLTRDEIFNPIVWVELSRLYSFLGNEKKAERAMTVALQMGPNNRHVLRSATRMFVHFEKPEKALHYLKRSDLINHDPWLMSAHIATSSLMDRYSTFIKPSIKLIESKNFSNYDLTELASSLGTLEFNEGSIKKSKSYVSLATASPNDNSLAQLEWLSSKGVFDFDPLKFVNVPNPFEAFSFEQFDRGNFDEAYSNSINWFLDIPYSKRPILFGSYLATMFLRDHDKSINLCLAGLKANHYDPLILNNLIYSLILLNKFDEAVPYINILSTHLDIQSLSPESQVTLLATFGLVAFRSGKIKSGKDFYNKSIDLADKLKNKHLKNLALLNYFRELLNSECLEVQELKPRILEIDTKSGKDLEFLKSDIIEMLKKKNV